MPTSHPLDQAIALTPTDTHTYRGQTHPGYANMVGPYGGIIAATLLNAALLHPERLGNPLSLTVNFVAPIQDGEFQVMAKPVRTNRSTQHWYLEISQEQGIAATATAIFANRRQTWGQTEATFPDTETHSKLIAADKLMPMPLEFTKRYDLRFAQGGPSLDATPLNNSHTLVWVQDNPPRPLDFASLTAICDVFFPRIFLVRPEWVPIGTVSITIYFHVDDDLLAQQHDNPVLGSVQGQNFFNGFFDHNGHIWGQDKTLLATTHQVVYYKH